MYVLDTHIISELRHGKPQQSTAVRAWAAMHISTPKPDRDAMLAATAIQHGMPLATRNMADFSDKGAQVMNPFDFV